MMKIMNVVGVSRWEDLKGKYIRVESEGWGGTITKIGNLLKNEWFDLKEFLGQSTTGLLAFWMKERKKMKKCERCAYLQEVGKKLYLVETNTNAHIDCIGDWCSLYEWYVLRGQVTDECKGYLTKSDLDEQTKTAEFIFRKESQDLKLDSDYYDNKYDN